MHLSEPIIAHIYGGALPQGMTRRVHFAPPVPMGHRGTPQKRDDRLGPILNALRANPWSTAVEVAKVIGKPPNWITGTMSRMCKNKILERRGRVRHFEYRVKE